MDGYFDSLALIHKSEAEGYRLSENSGALRAERHRVGMWTIFYPEWMEKPNQLVAMTRRSRSAERGRLFRVPVLPRFRE